MSAQTYIGLISGTSIDGVDAALVQIDKNGTRCLGGNTLAFEPALARALADALVDPQSLCVKTCGQLDAQLGEHFANAAIDLMAKHNVEPSSIAAIGSHGQTLYHAAEASDPYSIQVGDPARIAARTLITTVADFRRADIASGGQGAPLAPLLHEAVFASDEEVRAVVNLGGIANISVLQPDRQTYGYDTGPANSLMDLWANWCHQLSFDKDGEMAARGKVDQQLLKKMLSDTYFAKPGPKSTGREHFNAQWLSEHIGCDQRDAKALASHRQDDIMATLCELTARTIADQLGAGAGTIARIITCGGGAHNTTLCRRLSQAMDGIEVVSSGEYGIDPDYVEATLFAWLAAMRLAEKPVDTASITGANSKPILGAVHLPPRT